MQKIDRVEVVQYDPNWPRIFEAEAVQIKKALGCNCIAIHHVWSTSVPAQRLLVIHIFSFCQSQDPPYGLLL